MVLPESAAPDAHGQAVGWADEIGLSLGLSSGGAIALVDGAHPARLGDLVRTLRHRWPEIDVITEVRSLESLPEGSAAVLVPAAEDADWLNQRRPIFAQRKLKVVLWCSEETAAALAMKAPDFFDWISHRQSCPPGPAPFAVTGLRAAVAAGWPVAWKGTKRREAVEEVVRAALPGERAVVWVSGAEPYEAVRRKLGDEAIVGVEIGSARQLRRARWAYAEAQRKGRVIFVVGEIDCPGFWPLHDRFEDIAEARETLGKAGVKAPGRLAALLDLEPEAIVLVVRARKGSIIVGGRLSRESISQESLEAVIADGLDPASGVVRLLEANGKANTEIDLLPDDPVILRNLAVRPKAIASFEKRMESIPELLHRAELLHGEVRIEPRVLGGWGVHTAHGFEEHFARWPRQWAWAMEPVLRRGVSRPEAWLVMAAVAASLGDSRVARAWIARIERGARTEGPLASSLRRVEGAEELAALVKALGAASESIGNAMKSRRRRVHLLKEAAVPVALLLGALLLVVLGSIWGLLLGALAGAALSFIGYRRARAFNDPQEKEVAAYIHFATDLAYWIDETRTAVELARDRAGRERAVAAEPAAREALESAERRLGDEHPLYVEAAQLLAEILLAKHEPHDALDILAPLVSSDREIPDSLALLTASVLSEGGRAADAVDVLAHLTGVPVPPALLPAQPSASSPGDPIIATLLQLPAGTLAQRPDAHLALVEALLKQGRYPEALETARRACSTFADNEDPGMAKLHARLADLERRLGPPR
jgi:tetratricopeptide (TPR) repeat protein